MSKGNTTSNTTMNDTSLFNIVMFHDNAMNATLSQWVSDYSADKFSAMKEIIDFVFASSGCPNSINVEMIEDLDSISDILKRFQQSFNSDLQNGYPLLIKKKGRAQQKFKNSIADFWSKLISKTKSSHLFEDEGWMINTIFQWLGAMTSSTFRPFRHTATFMALCIQTALCDLSKENSAFINTAVKQLSKEPETSKKHALLSEKLQNLNEIKSNVEEWMTSFFDGVFIHRYRDSDPVIRTDCISALSVWIQRLSEKYLDSQYLRYLGWMFSDKISTVRLEAIKCIIPLYIKANISCIRNFTDRFKKRILEIAASDVETCVRIASIECLCRISELDLLDEEDSKTLIPLLFDSDVKIRSTCAPIISAIWQEELESLDNDNFSGLKAFCKIIIENSRIENPEILSREYSNNSFDDLDFKEEEILRDRKSDQNNLILWYSQSWKSPHVKLCKESLTFAVSALWTHISIVKDWELISLYFLSEIDDINCTKLSKEEEICAIHLFFASVITHIESPSKKKSSNETSDEISNSISRTLIKTIPVILSKYQSDFDNDQSILTDAVALIRVLEPQVYIDLRLQKEFESLLRNLNDIYLKHFNRELLQECTVTFRHLSGIWSEDDQTSSITIPEQLKMLAVENEKTLLNEIVFTQIIPSYMEIRAQIEQNPSQELDDLIILQNSINRISELQNCIETSYFDSLSIHCLADINSCYDLWYAIVDLALTILTKANSPSNVSILSASLILYNTLKVLMIQISFSLKTIYETSDVSSTKVSTTLAQADRLIEMCQAIITGDEDDAMILGIGLQTSTIHILSFLYLVLNGDLNQKIQSKRSAPELVQKKTVEIIERMIIALSIMDVSEEAQCENIHDNEFSTIIRHEILKSSGELVKLISNGVFNIKTAVLVLKYYGISGDSIFNASEIKNVSENSFGTYPCTFVFGNLWNSSGQYIINQVLQIQLSKNITDIDFSESDSMQIFEEICENVFNLIFDSINQALDLYLSGSLKSSDAVFDLAKQLIIVMKEWRSTLYLKSRQINLFKSMFMESFSRSCFLMIERVSLCCKNGSIPDRRLSVISDLTMLEDDRETVVCKIESLVQVNSIWKIWGAIGSVVYQLNQSHGEEDDDEKNEFEELKTNLLERMLEKGISPKENTKEWDSFFQFMKAIEKGDCNLRKARNTKRVKSKAEKAGAVVKKRKNVDSGNLNIQKSTRNKKMDKKLLDKNTKKMDKGSFEIGFNRRKSMRNSSGGRKVYAEVSSEESGESGESDKENPKLNFGSDSASESESFMQGELDNSSGKVRVGYADSEGDRIFNASMSPIMKRKFGGMDKLSMNGFIQEEEEEVEYMSSPGSSIGRKRPREAIKMARSITPELKKYMDKKLCLFLNGNRKVIGILRGYDPFLNLVLEDTYEVLSETESKKIGSVVIRGNSISLIEAMERIAV